MRTTQTIRSRVAISHVLLVAVTLVLYTGLASCLFWRSLTRQAYRDAIQNLETAVGLLNFDSTGQLLLREDYHDQAARSLQERLFEVRDFHDGQILYRNERLGQRTLGGPAFPGEGVNFSPRSYRMVDGTHVLLVSRVHELGNRTLLIRQANEIRPLVAHLQTFLAVLCLALLPALFVARLAGLRFASRTLGPLEQMVKMAERINPKRLNERLPVVSTDELGRLAIVINALLDNTQSVIDRLQRFTSDVSHELRTPLTALCSVGEAALEDPTLSSEYEETVASMLEEASRLTRLVDNLLMMSRMDTGEIKLNTVECNAFELLRQCVNLLDVLAHEKTQSLRFRISGDGTIVADELLLRQAFMNIIHNAIKFTPDGGLIEVEADATSPMDIEIRVDDQGPGIPEESRKKVFERFCRLPSSQAGAGLGLAIVKWIVESHNGEVLLTRNTSGGCRFMIRVPKNLPCLADQSAERALSPKVILTAARCA